MRRAFDARPSRYDVVGMDARLPSSPLMFESYSDDELLQGASRPASHTCTYILGEHEKAAQR